MQPISLKNILDLYVKLMLVNPTNGLTAVRAEAQSVP